MKIQNALIAFAVMCLIETAQAWRQRKNLNKQVLFDAYP